MGIMKLLLSITKNSKHVDRKSTLADMLLQRAPVDAKGKAWQVEDDP